MFLDDVVLLLCCKCLSTRVVHCGVISRLLSACDGMGCIMW